MYLERQLDSEAIEVKAYRFYTYMKIEEGFPAFESRM
jgi:hypothetical protein